MMRKSVVNISIIIILFVFLITANGDVCNNAVIKCNNSTNKVNCTIYQNNIIEAISQAISFCSAGSFTRLYIYIDSGLQSTTPIITLNLPSNIDEIEVRGLAKKQPVFIRSTQTHPNVSRIRLYDLVVSNSGILFTKFPNLISFNVYSGNFDTDINFSALKKLTSIFIRCSDQSSSNTTINKKWVGGLSKLQSLTIYSCGIQNITANAFKNLTSLTSLNLGFNNILELVPEVLRDLTALNRLLIRKNSYAIRISKDFNNQTAFSHLKALTYLYLRNTVIIPFDAFSTISSIQRLSLPKTSTGIVPSTSLQHLHKLTYLSFNGISPICNCSMQWASIVPKFGINIQNRSCSNSRNYVTDSSLYTGCGLTESYQCFNKTVACNNTCINTLDSYICACDAGYGLSLLESESACQDIDECLANKSPCKQKCRNTLGSYQCYCDSGYRLSDDLISCTDIDECSQSSWNTCGQHQCLNEVGSYRCKCSPGYQLAGDGYSCYDLDECSNANTCNQHICINELGTYTCCCRQGYQLTMNGKNCRDINECSLSGTNSCGDHQCINEKGSYRCVCNEGFKLADNGISCHDADECMDANNSCNQHECLNLVGSYTCQCEEGYQLATNGKTCEDRPNNVSSLIQSTDSAQSTGYSNVVFIGVIVFLVIIIIILILLLLTSLSINIYTCYNKRNTIVNFQELPGENQSEGKQYIELATDVAAANQRNEPNNSQIPPAMNYANMSDDTYEDISQYVAMK